VGISIHTHNGYGLHYGHTHLEITYNG